MIFVVEDEDRWVAMVGCLADEEDCSVATLWGMWVEPGARGRGVGERLVATIVEWTRQRGAVARLELGVRPANRSAVSLYERAGFMVSGAPRAVAGDDSVLETPMTLSLAQTPRP